MQVHKLTICVVDHDRLGAEEIQEVIENESWPNHCINPQIVSVETREIGEWSDDNPLNKNSTFESTFEELFAKGEASEPSPIEYAGRPQRNPPAVEARKPFIVYEDDGRDNCSGVTTYVVICIGDETAFPNTHPDTNLVRFNDQTEAEKLADSLNEAFANHFDV